MARIQPTEVGQTMTIMDTLLAELERVVQETLQPEGVSVRLKPTGRGWGEQG